MVRQEEITKDFENDYVNKGLSKLVNGETVKKVARKVVIEVEEEHEVITGKTKQFLRLLTPISFLVFIGLIIGASIKNVIGVERFVRFAENFVKLILL